MIFTIVVVIIVITILNSLVALHAHTDLQIVTDAFKKYAVQRAKNIPLLSEYARALKVENKLRSYMEVLL